MKTERNPKGAGRKGKYHSHVEPRLESITAMKRRGLEDKQIATAIGIRPETFCRYKLLYPQFAQSVKTGDIDAIGQVENSLFKRAIGYDYTETKTVKDGAGKIIGTEEVTKHQPASVSAMIYFLNNRAPDSWNNKHYVQHAGMDFKQVTQIFNSPTSGNCSDDDREQIRRNLAAHFNGGNGSRL